MKYDITKPQAPAMPTLGKGTECIKILLSQASKDMHEPLVPMLSPLLAHISSSLKNDPSPRLEVLFLFKWHLRCPKVGRGGNLWAQLVHFVHSRSLIKLAGHSSFGSA